MLAAYVDRVRLKKGMVQDRDAREQPCEYTGVVPVASRLIRAQRTLSRQLHKYPCCWAQGRVPSCAESKYTRNCFFQVLKVDVEASCLSFSGLSSYDEGFEGALGAAA